MNNNTQQNINATSERPLINPIPPTSTKKLNNKIIALSVLIVIVVAVGYILPKHRDLAGGGAANQIAPDSVKTGDTAIVRLELSVPGSKQNINGRYTDIAMHYYLTESDVNITQPKLISQTKD